MKFLFGFLSLIMLSFVAVQYNDPDAMRWMIIYGFCAILMILATFGFYTRNLIYAGYVIFGSGFVFLFPSLIEWITKESGQNLMQRMADSKMYIEETRECLGLAICLVFTSLLWIPIRRAKYTNK